MEARLIDGQDTCLKSRLHGQYTCASCLENGIFGKKKNLTVLGSLYISGKLPTYPSPKPTLTLTSALRVKCWPTGVSQKRMMIPVLQSNQTAECKKDIEKLK